MTSSHSLERVKRDIRLRGYSIRTEKAYQSHYDSSPTALSKLPARQHAL